MLSVKGANPGRGPEKYAGKRRIRVRDAAGGEVTPEADSNRKAHRKRQKSRRTAFLRYLLVILIGNLVWEALQMPLYTLWVDGTWGQIVYALVHCTLGDVLIGAATLLAALLLLRAAAWPDTGRGQVMIVTLALALAYTVFSEWLNVEVRQSWAYRDIMPRLPWLGTGLSPLVQWIAVPLLAFRLSHGPGPDR